MQRNVELWPHRLGEAGFAVADVRDELAVRNAVAACLDRFGRIDALLNVAGISARSAGDGPLHECKPAAWDLVMDVNAKGTFLMCREVLGVWTRNTQAGVILNCGSVLARHPQRDHFATVGYAASKGAIEAMSLSAAAYYAPAGIRINVIAPGLVRTPMSARAQAESADHRIHDPQTAAEQRHAERGGHRQDGLLPSAPGFQPDHRPDCHRGRRLDGERMTPAKKSPPAGRLQRKPLLCPVIKSSIALCKPR